MKNAGYMARARPLFPGRQSDWVAATPNGWGVLGCCSVIALEMRRRVWMVFPPQFIPCHKGDPSFGIRCKGRVKTERNLFNSALYYKPAPTMKIAGTVSCYRVTAGAQPKISGPLWSSRDRGKGTIECKVTSGGDSLQVVSLRWMVSCRRMNQL